MKEICRNVKRLIKKGGLSGRRVKLYPYSKRCYLIASKYELKKTRKGLARLGYMEYEVSQILLDK